MREKIISAALAVALAFGITACGGSENTEMSTTSQATTAAITTATTTLPSTTAATAPATTEKATTTKKPTTARKVTTTKKVTTAKATTTEKQTEKEKDYRKEEKTFTEELRYGVICTKTVIRYYETLDDGSEVLAEEKVTAKVINRLRYSAAYEDLLPAAKENSKTYRDYIEKILEITNGYRAEGGIEPLELDERLVEIACVRAEELAWSALHEHTRPGLKSFNTVFKEGGIEKGFVGENIGWGFKTPESVCQAWKDSETHYENIMNPDFVKVGFGVAPDPEKEGTYCWAQHFWDGEE